MPDPVQAIGIDAGGSKVSVGLIDTATGRVLRQASLPTPPRDQADGRFLALVAQAVRALGAGPIPVGLGICELVDLGGEVVSDHRIRWSRAEVRAAFAQAPRLVIEADVRAAAIAEARLGAARGLDHWIYANAGTGIALVPMQGDHPHRGAHGRALAVGVGPASLLPGQDGTTIEDFAGGGGLLGRARMSGLPCATTADLVTLADQGDTRALDLVMQGGAVFGGLLALAVNMLDPQDIVLGGGLVLASAPYRDAMKAAFDAGLWYRPSASTLQLRVSALGMQAGLIGAALCTALHEGS